LLRTPAPDTFVHDIETQLLVIDERRVLGYCKADVGTEHRPWKRVPTRVMRYGYLVHSGDEIPVGVILLAGRVLGVSSDDTVMGMCRFDALANMAAARDSLESKIRFECKLDSIMSLIDLISAAPSPAGR
jgi:hypothetical protein